LPPHHLTPAEAIAEAELGVAPDDRPATVSAGWWSRLAPFAAVSAGAVVGANGRYLVGMWVAARWPGAFPWGTLLINLTGSLVLGFFLTLIAERYAEPPFVRLFLATGLLGAYTTFSTFSVETVTLFVQGQLVFASGYIALSIIGGYGLARGGLTLARRLS
jgi:CrcB protein